MRWWSRSKGSNIICGERWMLSGNVLDVLLQRHRDTHAAKRFFRKLLKKQGFVPQAIVTDKLKSYEAAKKQVLKRIEHRQHKGLNNLCENSHQPTRTRERRMRRFKSPGQAQRFLSAFEPIRDHFHPKQHQLGAQRYREQLANDLKIGKKLLGWFLLHNLMERYFLGTKVLNFAPVPLS